MKITDSLVDDDPRVTLFTTVLFRLKVYLDSVLGKQLEAVLSSDLLQQYSYANLVAVATYSGIKLDINPEVDMDELTQLMQKAWT